MKRRAWAEHTPLHGEKDFTFSSSNFAPGGFCRSWKNDIGGTICMGHLPSIRHSHPLPHTSSLATPFSVVACREESRLAEKRGQADGLRGTFRFMMAEPHAYKTNTFGRLVPRTTEWDRVVFLCVCLCWLWHRHFTPPHFLASLIFGCAHF